MTNDKTAELPSIDRFVQILVRCGLFERSEVYSLLQSAPAEARSDSQKLAHYLVARDRLTHFQATKLLQGIWQGLVLGPYQILSPLGRGGMSTVYLARMRNAEFGMRNESHAATPHSAFRIPNSGLVALKVLPPKRIKEDEKKLARFLREMDLARRVSHPHLTTTYDGGEIQGVYYIAMEYIRGQDLKQRVEQHGPLLVARAARLFSEVAAGLAQAHKDGIIHRDLKPGNIMVTPNGHAKVLDLGFALAAGEELPADKQIVGGKGYVVGTMDYIPPEQVEDPTGVDFRADLYALGCSMYFALTGQPPFPGGTAHQKMQRHRTEFAEPIPDLNPTVAVEFARIIEKLMEKDPRRRYPDAEAVRQALLPWAIDDPDLPLDVTPEQSETETVHEVEAAHSMAASVWDSIPVITFRQAGAGGILAVPADQFAEEVRGAVEVAAPKGQADENKPFLFDGLPALVRAAIYVWVLLVVVLLLSVMR